MKTMTLTTVTNLPSNAPAGFLWSGAEKATETTEITVVGIAAVRLAEKLVKELRASGAQFILKIWSPSTEYVWTHLDHYIVGDGETLYSEDSAACTARARAEGVSGDATAMRFAHVEW